MEDDAYSGNEQQGLTFCYVHIDIFGGIQMNYSDKFWLISFQNREAVRAQSIWESVSDNLPALLSMGGS